LRIFYKFYYYIINKISSNLTYDEIIKETYKIIFLLNVKNLNWKIKNFSLNFFSFFFFNNFGKRSFTNYYFTDIYSRNSKILQNILKNPNNIIKNFY
jgi:hypothetical protein